MEEATANLEPTLIRRAYDLRHSKPILRHLSNDGSDAASDARASSSLNAQRPVPAPLSVVCEPVYSASEWRLASSLLDDHQWADAVREELGEGVCVFILSCKKGRRTVCCGFCKKRLRFPAACV